LSSKRDEKKAGNSISNNQQHRNRPALKTRFGDAARGIEQHLTTDVTLGGVKYAPPALIAVFTGASAAVDKADADHKQWLDSVASMKTTVAQANAVYKLLRNYLIGIYGTAEKTSLGDFGMAAPKPTTKKTASTKAAAVVKGQATRKLRNTMGPKQKKQVKSDIKVQISAVAGDGTAALATQATAATTLAPNGVAATATATKPAS
jgi:hypothetical protein